MLLEPVIEVHLSPERAPSYAAVVTLRGEHDLATSADLGAALAPILGDVVVDLTSCEFMDSTVIGVLLAKQHDLTREGHALELVVPSTNARVTRVVDVIGMRTLLTVHDQFPI